MKPHLYALVDRVPVPLDDEDDILVWGAAFNSPDRRVAETQVTAYCRVSTVFLGLDHSFSPDGPPILFETMIFGGPLDGYQRRCATWGEAETEHAIAVAEVEASLPNK